MWVAVDTWRFLANVNAPTPPVRLSCRECPTTPRQQQAEQPQRRAHHMLRNLDSTQESLPRFTSACRAHRHASVRDDESSDTLSLVSQQPPVGHRSGHGRSLLCEE